jgi:hypothetical protein
MNRIMIDVSKGELDYIREAIQHKHVSLMSYLETCENDSQKEPEPQKILLNSQQVEAIKRFTKKPHWTQTPEGKKIMAKRRRRGQK